AFSGHFGGEIRLAYLYDENGNRSLVTGGSVNGEIFSCQKDIVFSDERYSAYDYEGPFAMKVKGVSVAGL
ncbi:MAG: TldD/PmbA family protein, partial [Clostridiales bacterium]|nr:TldD/PmbA family protein [Clostridiales bacterium]